MEAYAVTIDAEFRFGSASTMADLESAMPEWTARDTGVQGRFGVRAFPRETNAIVMEARAPSSKMVDDKDASTSAENIEESEGSDAEGGQNQASCTEEQ